MTLTEFLTARLDEEQIAADMFSSDPDWDAAMLATLYRPTASNLDPVIIHASRYDPARVLREVKAKRKILAEYAPVAKNDGEHEPEYAYGWAEGLGMAVRALATVYSDHPDYDSAWGGEAPGLAPVE
jgi:hypothetical protein